MTERTSERIWQAAQAAYEGRAKLIATPWEGMAPWQRDIEYDAMVAAFSAVPIGSLHDFAAIVASLGEAQQRKDARIAELEAELERCRTPATPPDFENILDAAGKIQERRIAELEDHVRVHEPSLERIKEAHTIMSMEAMREESTLRHRVYAQGQDEGCYLCALVMKVERADKRVAELEAERDEYKQAAEVEAGLRREARSALKPFAEYAERIEKEQPGWFDDRLMHHGTSIPMAWFIAALKAYRGEGGR